MNVKKKRIQFVAFALIFLVLFVFISNALEISDSTSLANIKGFYLEPHNSIDVAMIGPSEFYADYSPTQAWSEYGYTSYSLAVAGIPGNMYRSMLDEVLTRQNPKLVVFELNAFMQKDSYFERKGKLHTWIDNIPWSANKIKTIERDIPKEDRASYYFKMLTYHGNWINPLDIARCLYVKAHMFLKGSSYTKGFGTCTSTSEVVGTYNSKKAHFTELSESYLTELLSYCKEKNLKQVLFVRFPHEHKIENPEVMAQMQSLIESYGYDYLNLNDSDAVTGIVPGRDYYNSEHLNVNGMEKMTRYFGGYITSHYDIETNHSAKQIAYWNRCAKKTQFLLARCKKDLKYGIVRRYYEISA